MTRNSKTQKTHNPHPHFRGRRSPTRLINTLTKIAWLAMATVLILFAINFIWPTDENTTKLPEKKLPGEKLPGAHQEVTLAGQTFNLELALTARARTIGLMHRPTLPADSGMLFVFPDTKVRDFWMKNCLIPLDIIFLDDKTSIISIHSLAPPAPGTPGRLIPRCISPAPARYVIELNAGTADKLGLRTGDKVDLPTEQLKPHAR